MADEKVLGGSKFAKIAEKEIVKWKRNAQHNEIVGRSTDTTVQ